MRLYAKGWQREQASLSAAAFVPLSFNPGEAYPFDWSHKIVPINGTTVTIKVARSALLFPDGVINAADVYAQGPEANVVGTSPCGFARALIPADS